MRSFQKWGWGQGAAGGESKSLGQGRSGVVGTLLLVLNFKKYACMCVCVCMGGVLEHVCTWESVRATSWELDLSNHHVISGEYTQVSSVEDTAV